MICVTNASALLTYRYSETIGTPKRTIFQNDLHLASSAKLRYLPPRSGEGRYPVMQKFTAYPTACRDVVQLCDYCKVVLALCCFVCRRGAAPKLVRRRYRFCKEKLGSDSSYVGSKRSACCASVMARNV